MSHAPNLRESLARARLLGCAVGPARRTGETVITHPRIGRVRVNGRRKDTPKPVLTFLRKVEEAG